MDKDQVIDTLQLVLKLLIDKNYEELYKLDYLKDGDYNELWLNIKEYGGEVTMPPRSYIENPKLLDIDEDEATVDFDLWIDNKESDLTIELELRLRNEIVEYNIVDIHIM